MDSGEDAMSAKDWTGDLHGVLRTIGARSSEEREENDYYATDPRAIDLLLTKETPSRRIWEPSSGGGHLSNRLKQRGFEVVSSDIIDRGAQDFLADFLKCEEPFDGDILTNPPYKYAEQFVLKALELARGRVFMFLKLTFLEGQARYERIYKEHPPRRVYAFPKRILCGKNGNFPDASAVAYAWFVWEKGYKGEPSIGWLDNIERKEK